MPTIVRDATEQRSLGAVLSVGLAAAVLIAVGDYLTGADGVFTLLYAVRSVLDAPRSA